MGQATAVTLSGGARVWYLGEGGLTHAALFSCIGLLMRGKVADQFRRLTPFVDSVMAGSL